jgi:hypothetical protein
MPGDVAEPQKSSELDRVVSDLWRFYDEHAAQARQHETLRATVTSILTGFAAALVGFAGIGGLEPSDVPAGVFVVLIGVLGALLSLKHYERNRFHVQVLAAVRREIDRLRPTPERVAASTGDLRKVATGEHKAEFSQKVKYGSLLVQLSLFQLWVALHLAIAAVGAVIVAVSLA